MKRFLFFLFSLLPLIVAAQYPTVTTQISIAKEQASHGLSVGDWLTVDDNGLIVKGSDPGTQPFFGVVSRLTPSDPTNKFEYVLPGGPITFPTEILTAGEIYYAQDDGTLEPASTATDTNKPVLKAISTTQAILYSGAFGAADLPPPSTQVQNISFSDISSTSVTATASGGDGSGVIMLISLNPINFSPQNNVDYSGAENLNFGSGNDVSGGSGVYVVLYGDESSAVITGLSAASTYHIHAYRYVTSGGLISYNLSTQGFNTASVNTFADASTPTQQWQKVSVKPLETSIRVTGTRGNGDQILVVASTDSIPDTDPSDAVDYSLGEALGNGFIAYKGTSTTFDITGLTRDRKVYYKVFEREDTGYLYNTQTEVDSAWTCYFYIDTWTQGAGDPAGETYLESNAYVYYDFSDLTFADEANITNGDAGLVDQGPNANTGTVVGVPTTNEITLNSAARKAARSSSTQAISTGNTGVSWFTNASGFEIHHVFRIEDGVTTGAFHSTCGGGDNTYRVLIRFNATGNLQLQYVYNTNFVTWTSTSAVLADGANQLVVQAKFDFVNDTFSAWVDGVSEPGSSAGFPISSINPATWTTTENFYVVNHNIGGTAGTHHSAVSMARFAVTPILTDQQRTDIHDFFAFTASGTSDILGWTKTETSGFTQTVSNDSLNISGNAGGFGDFTTYTDVLPDSLQEFVLVMTYTIEDDLTTNPSGIGIGFRGDAGDPNYAVVGQVNMDTDAASFGSLQLFSGNGNTGITEIDYRGASSGVLAPAKDSVHLLSLERTVSGNDAFHAVRVTNGYDSLTVGALSPNRPESAGFGTDNRAYIWFQGPDFTIGEFWIVRTSEAQVTTAPPPTPVTGDVYTSPSGISSGNCPESAPCDLPRGLARIAELGGSDRTLVMSAGTFTINTQLILPPNLGDMVGAGIDQTFIQGTSNLNANFNYDPTNVAMLRAITSGSRITVTTHLKGFTLIGGTNEVRQKSWGLTIKKRDGFTVENVGFHYFRSGGFNVDDCDDVTLINPRFIASSGSGTPASTPEKGQNPATGWPYTSEWTSTTPYNQFGYSLGAVTLRGSVDNFEWDGGSYEGLRFGNGYGVKSLGGGDLGTAILTNHEYHNITLSQNPFSSGSTGNNFFLEYHGSSPTTFGEFDFHDNTITIGGALSLVPDTSNGNDHRVYNNYVSLSDGFFIEANTHRLKLYNNFITSTGNGNAPIFVSTVGNFNAMSVYDNIIEFLTSSVTTGVINTRGWLTDVLIENNTVNYLSTSGAQIALFYSNYSGGSQSTGIIRNNAFIGDNPGSNNMIHTPAKSNYFSSVTIQNNFATHLLTTQSVSGGSSSGNLTGQNATGWFNYTGTKFNFTSTGYYFPKTGSALRDAATDGSDVGALQH